jgi:IS5 family transposase
MERGYADKGYCGHDTPNPRRIFISGQKRGVFGIIKRELRRRSAIKDVIGHMKTDGHLGRCHLKGRAGDAANAVLTAVGYNFRLVLAWLRQLLLLILAALLNPHKGQPVLKSAS